MRKSRLSDSPLPVFSKCAESIAEGKRLENLSWRLWNRETFCCEAQPHLATTPAIHVPRRQPSPKEVPSLSSSVDSAASEDTERTRTVRPTTIPRNSEHRPEEAEDSALSRSRGKEKHITSFGLEQMIINIKEKTDIEPLSPTIAASLPALPDIMSDITPRPSSPFPHIETNESSPESQLQNSSDSCFSNVTSESTVSNGGSDHGSDTSVSSGDLTKSASVIKGFSSSQMSSSFRSKSNLSQDTAVPTQPQQVGKLEVQKKSNMFMLGGSSGDDESSFEDRVSRQPKQSSISNSLKSKPLDKSKKPSFKEIVQSRRIEEADTEDEDAIESGDDDDGEASESAIEEDDAAWEDSDSESGHTSPVDKNLFQRVESKANLTSRPSMLTMQLHNPQRATAISNAASRSSPALRRSRTASPNGPSHPDSSDENENEPVLTMRGPQSSRPMPITCTTTKTHPPAHSPRTTRRNMLATELTESLRKHLLWERKQKSTTANAFLKRRHTARDVVHLQEYPDLKPDLAAVEASKTNSWNHYFEGPWEYHTKGW
jgi:Protein of unknown function (DUF3295)/Fungal protein of unknown function (DUF1752)